MRSETERESELVCVTCVCVTVSLCVHVCACVCLYLCMICNARAELRRENCFLPFFFKNSFLRKYFFEKKLCRHRTSMLKNGATKKMKLFSSSFFLKWEKIFFCKKTVQAQNFYAQKWRNNENETADECARRLARAASVLQVFLLSLIILLIIMHYSYY